MFQQLIDSINSSNLPAFFVVLTFVLEPGVFFAVYYSVAKYVFFEIFPRTKGWIIYYLLILFACAFLCLAFNDLFLIVIAVGLVIPLFIRRKKRAWVMLVQMVPMTTFSTILISVLTDVPKRFITNPDGKYIVALCVYAAVCLGLLFLITIGKKWRNRFDNEISKRKLATWERTMLIVVGMILVFYLIFNYNAQGEQFLATYNTLEGKEKLYVDILFATFALACFSLALASIIVITMSNKKAAYQAKLLDMQSNVIGVMAEIIENRDENTGGHIQRTAKYVEIIATELQSEGKYKEILTNRYIADMKVAAPLHDIGKVHVSDVVLNKPGRLDEEEYDVMKTHAEEGRKLLAKARESLGDFSYLDIAVEMAGGHHEWWDGTGYPDHKKGEEIPLCARIMAVADVFDALTSDRCYRAAMTLEEAYEIIRNENGTHFDTVVVDAFFAAHEEIEEALKTFRDK